MVIAGAGPPNSEVEDDGVGAGAPNAPKIDVPGVVVVDPKIPPPEDGAGAPNIPLLLGAGAEGVPNRLVVPP